MFLYQPLWGDVAPFRALLAELDLPLITRTAPSASDALHQYLLTTLAGGATLDVFVIDTIWVAELVRAGFLAELTIEPSRPGIGPTSCASTRRAARESDCCAAGTWGILPAPQKARRMRWPRRRN